MGIGDVGLGKLNIFCLYVAVRRPFFSRKEYQWLTIKNWPITVLAKDDVLREGDVAQRDPDIAHAAHSFRNSVANFSIILYAALRNQFAMLSLDANLSPSARVIALDIGGTSVKSALIAPGGHVIGKPSITPIDSSGEADSILSAFAQIIRTHIRERDRKSTRLNSSHSQIS